MAPAVLKRINSSDLERTMTVNDEANSTLITAPIAAAAIVIIFMLFSTDSSIIGM